MTKRGAQAATLFEAAAALTARVGVLVDEAVPLFLLIDLGGLDVALSFLMFLQMGLLPEEDPTGRALERPHPLVDPLMHVAIAGRGEDLATCLTWVLPLFQLLVALFMCLIMTP